MTYTKHYRNFLLSGILLLLCIGLYTSCRMTYGFVTKSIDYDKVKTFSVYYFPNRARLVNPNLSQQITEALQDKLLRQTSLDQLTESGDLEFEGQITGYDTRPMNISEGDFAAQTRLTVTVKVKYTNNTNREDDWEKTFSAYADFDATRILSDVEDELMVEIIEQITEDIFNASIAKW